jgi:endoglucanase
MKKTSAFLLSLFMLLIMIASMSTMNAYAAEELKVQLYYGNRDTTTSSISLVFNLVNNGKSALDLSTVKMRYYFTNDGEQTDNFACDYSPVNSANVTGVFGTVNAKDADRYIEVGFNSNSGTLEAGKSIEVHTRVWKSDWSAFTQTNDYSFKGSAVSFTDLLCVPCYINNKLVWGTEPDQTVVVTSVPTLAPTIAPTVTPTPTPAATAAPTPKISELVPKLSLTQYNTPDNEGMKFVENMKIGWNLGNTFDAINCTWITNELEYETAWCGSYTTRGLIDTLKNSGFNAIRIPVSWHNHVSGENFKISEVWINRVQEVVNYCMDNNMYVILNIHHDVDKVYYYPSSTYLKNSKHYMTCIWKQIAAKFAEYDDHLIYESINEPRLTGHTNEWWIDPGNADCIDSIRCINELNQVFVDTVRATGGKNAVRYLMCPGYCASPDGAVNTNFKMPTDIIGNINKLILSVHAYTPYNFALEETGTNYWGVNDKSSVRNIVEFMDNLYNKYTSKGIPIVIGEFGARNKKDNLKSRVEFASYYIAAARARGISCIWWDNNAFTGEGELFGLINRSTYEYKYPEIVQGMMKYAERK